MSATWSQASSAMRQSPLSDGRIQPPSPQSDRLDSFSYRGKILGYPAVHARGWPLDPGHWIMLLSIDPSAFAYFAAWASTRQAIAGK